MKTTGAAAAAAAAAAATSRNNKNKQQRPLIIFCHGSGDTGPGAQAWIESLVPPTVMQQWDWIFPSAEPIPYQLSGGMISSVWYDRVGGFAPNFPEQTKTVERSTDRLLQLIEEQITTHKRSAENIVIGGFSMGGAIALQTAARWHAHKKNDALGAVFGLSCYLNDDSKVWDILKDQETVQKWPKTFMAHGSDDDFILPQWGKSTQLRLARVGVSVSFRMVPNTHHEMVTNEIAELLNFLQATDTATMKSSVAADSREEL